MKVKNRREAAPASSRGLRLACILALSGMPLAHAEPQADAWHANADSVLELLQADTRRALENANLPARDSPAAEPAQATAVKRADDIRLAALYGVDGNMTAVVYVNGVHKEYRPGAKLPYAGAGSAVEYRLLRIVDSCVVLQKKGSKRVRSACFQPALEPAFLAPRVGSTALASGSADVLGSPLPLPARP